MWHGLRGFVCCSLFVYNFLSYYIWPFDPWVMWPVTVVLFAAYLESFIRVCLWFQRTLESSPRTKIGGIT